MTSPAAALINGMEQGPVFASEDPPVLVAVLGNWSPHLQRSTEWGWKCVTCGDARRGAPTKTSAAVSAEDHYHWHQRDTGRSGAEHRRANR